MPSPESVVTRLVARIRSVLTEDWIGAAGRRFRHTLSRISDLNQKHLHLEERVSATPDLAWNAVQGIASEKHAKATSDYSKAENDRIDAALKRRVIEDKVRQERATADKLEAEANLARIRELQARVELAKQLAALGVSLVLDENAVIRAYKRPYASRDMVAGILNVKEQKLWQSAVFDVVVPELYSPENKIGTLINWFKSVGDVVKQGEALFAVTTPIVDVEMPSPFDGTLVEILVSEGTEIRINETVVARLRRTAGTEGIAAVAPGD